MKRLVVLLVFFTLLSQLDAQKKVVIEKFTNSSCGACADAALLIKDLTDEFPELIWVSHQKTHDWRINPLANEVSWTLWQEVNKIGNPSAMIDRDQINGNLVTFRGNWREKIIEQLNEPDFVQIDISKVKFDTLNRELSFDVHAEFSEIPSSHSLRLTAMIVQDSVWGEPQDNYNNDTPGHPHEGKGVKMWDYPHRNVVRTMLDDHWGSADFFPEDPVVGESYSKSYSYVIPEDHRELRHKIVCFVSEHGPTLADRKIFNAQEVKLRSVNLTLSEKDISQLVKLYISPNPVFGELTVQSPAHLERVSVFDLEGRLVYQERIADKSARIDLRFLVEGAYVVRVDTKEGSVSKKFIRKK